MAMELIDGFAGAPHISGEDLAALNQGCFGDGDYVFEYGNNLAATVTNANTVQIGTGALVSKGRRSVNLAAQQLTIQSGTQGQKRNDLVVARYSKASGTNVESTTLAVVRGTPVSYGDAADPDVTANDMKLWRIPIDGITPGTPVQLFEVMKPMSELWDSVSQGDWAYLYGSGTISFVRYRRVGSLVFLQWNIVQGTENYWAAGNLPEWARPAATIYAPACVINTDGIVRNICAYVYVNAQNDGEVGFKIASTASDADTRNTGIICWPIG